MGQKLSSICTLSFTTTLTSDVSTHRFVNVNSAQAGDGEAAIGVAANDETADNAVTVKAIGVFDMIAGAAIAKGADVQSDASGKPITKATGVATGLALTAAVNPGDIVKILIK